MKQTDLFDQVGAKGMPGSRQTDLEDLIAADAADWNYPSPGRALKVHDLEKQFEEKWGEPAPAWPARGRW